MKSLVLKEVKRDAKLKITKFYKNINTSPTKRTKHNKKAAVLLLTHDGHVFAYNYN